MNGDLTNDHAHEPWPDVSYGAMARAAAMVAGDPDWVNVTRWPRAKEAACTPEGHAAFDAYDGERLRPHLIACGRCGETRHLASRMADTLADTGPPAE